MSSKKQLNITPDQFTKWLEDLRSGNFVQGMNNLKEEFPGKPRYCCLGVLGEQLGILFEDAPDRGLWFTHSTNGKYVHRSSEYLPYSLVDQTDQGTMADWNDDEMLSFAEIADRLEEQYEGTPQQ